MCTKPRNAQEGAAGVDRAGSDNRYMLGQGRESWAPTSRDGQDGAASVRPGWARRSPVCTPGDAQDGAVGTCRAGPKGPGHEVPGYAQDEAVGVCCWTRRSQHLS